MKAFAETCGGQLDIGGRYRGGPSAFYGVTPDTFHAWKGARESEFPFWYVDHAYFNRGGFWRVTKNAQQCGGTGEGLDMAPDFDRFDRLGVEIEPWRAPGRHIVVCLQSDWWFRRSLGYDGREWRRRIEAELRRHTDRPIVVRDKPEVAKAIAPDAVAEAGAAFRAAIEGAHAVVTFQSNAAVQAICAGVPAFVTGQSAAEPMASGDLSEIERPRRPDGRREWAAVLAANQWTVDEIRSGVTWRAIGGDR